MRISVILILLSVFSAMANSNSTESTSQQQNSISGKVLDEAGQPLPGATVIKKGTTEGTVTNIDGAFTLANVANGTTLVISFVGFLPQEIVFEGQPTIEVTMKIDAIGLEEVIAIGYGTMRKSDLTGSVVSIKGDDIAAYPVSSAAQALIGKVPGVTVMSQDGRPNAEVSIRVRGGGSITQSNDPLYILDGFPVGNINDIPPSQIESITILKDASSTAIYGARGANGVILVTTKSPGGDKISVSYDGNYRINTPTKYIGALNAYDFVKMNWEYGTIFGLEDAWERAYGLGSNYSDLNPGGIGAYSTSDVNDIERKIIRTSYSQNHNITLSGGTSKTKYSISVDHLDDEGMKIQSWYKRTNILAKLQSEIAKGLTFSLNTQISDEEEYGKNNLDWSVGTATLFTPVTPLGDISGDNTQLGMYDMSVRPEFNPIDQINDIIDQDNSQRLRANASLSWEPVDNLKLHTEYGLTRSYSKNREYTGPVANNTVGVYGGDAKMKSGQSTGYRWLNTLNYKFKNLGDSKLDVLLGQEFTGKDGESMSIEGTKFPISFDSDKVFAMMNQYGEQMEISLSSSVSEPRRLSSYFGRMNYSYKDRYLFSATLRADGSSNFAPTHRWGYFPAAALAWRISEEPLLQDIDILDNLKLRLSYGEAGSDHIDAGLWKMDWTAEAEGYPYRNVYNPFYVPSSETMINPDLKWETTVTRNIGVDFSLFNNRLYGTVDAYWNTTKDLLMVNTLPSFTGYESQMANVGQTSNKGIEFAIGGDLIRNDEFKFSANMNISFNKNNVDALSEEMESHNYKGKIKFLPLFDYVFEVGKPVGLIRGYTYDGYYTTDDFNYDSETQEYTLREGVANSWSLISPVPDFGDIHPGMIKFKKMGTEEEETIINEADDVTIIGDTNPLFTGGLNLNSSYKGFDLMLGFNWSYGNDIYNTHYLTNTAGKKTPFRNFASANANWYTLYDIDASGDLQRVYAPAELDALNANAEVPMPFHENDVAHTGGIEDGSFLRLNNVTLGYTIPSNISQRILIQRFRVYATITNAWLWSSYSGYDPEINSGGGVNDTYPTPGMDYGTYPRARTVTFGVNVNF
jgi:TonB-linked SusC/RagA family outer membrane protein